MASGRPDRGVLGQDMRPQQPDDQPVHLPAALRGGGGRGPSKQESERAGGIRAQSRLQRRKTELSETKEKPERSNAADVAESLLLALDAGPNKPSLPALEAMLAEALKANDVTLVRAFAQPPAPPAQSKTADVEAELADARRELAHEAYGAASMLADGVMDDADWELFDLADEARSAAVELLRALDGEA
uniref:Uncharacterized protein n=1 Tax=Siphoviridae sp. ctDCt3 TaxID=2825385 RepID=A0A8S5U244_9CAUD|nr:MAG TPA: hypothetical protein [Siphoviridae sp. ctDCt3]